MYSTDRHHVRTGPPKTANQLGVVSSHTVDQCLIGSTSKTIQVYLGT